MSETPVVFVGYGGNQRLHLIEERISPPPPYEGEWARTACHRQGRVQEVNLAEDPRQLCSLCAWNAG